ncbi:transposase [Gammaproteobacteria bacterium]
MHLFCRLGRTISQSNWVKEIKLVSSIWIKDRDSKFEKFAWQVGYGTFSVSLSNVETVHRYIAGQEEHHQKLSFRDEYRTFL